MKELKYTVSHKMSSHSQYPEGTVTPLNPNKMILCHNNQERQMIIMCKNDHVCTIHVD